MSQKELKAGSPPKTKKEAEHLRCMGIKDDIDDLVDGFGRLTDIGKIRNYEMVMKWLSKVPDPGLIGYSQDKIANKTEKSAPELIKMSNIDYTVMKKKEIDTDGGFHKENKPNLFDDTADIDSNHIDKIQ